MTQFVNENIFDNSADILINTVNCVGIMGKGIALEFKNRFPDMFAKYKKACKQKEINPGSIWIYTNSTDWIINFATKDHWKNNSKYDWIENGLIELRDYLLAFPDASIRMPALGCGNGNLNWEKVKNLIEIYLSKLSNKITVCNPYA